MSGPLSLENLPAQFCSDWLKDEIKRVLNERDSALAKLKAISGHVEFIRHDEKRHKEVGKEKVAWDKLNGALSAIERELSADAGPAKCSSIDGQCVHWRGAGGPVGECIYCGKQPKPARERSEPKCNICTPERGCPDHGPSLADIGRGD